MACLERRVRPILSGPVCLTLEWHLKRPKADWDKGGHVRPKAPSEPVKKPDIDKLTRAVLDGLSKGVAYSDDSQVIEMHCKKRYILREGDKVGLWIVISGCAG